MMLQQAAEAVDQPGHQGIAQHHCRNELPAPDPGEAQQYARRNTCREVFSAFYAVQAGAATVEDEEDRHGDEQNLAEGKAVAPCLRCH